MIERVFIAGTGLIGASVGLALRETGFRGEIVGSGPTEATLQAARRMGAIDRFVLRESGEIEAVAADLVLLAGPVLAIEDWMQRLAPLLSERTLVTDVGSTKAQIAALGAKLYNQPGRARFLPGHPMAGKETGGAAQAEASLFHGAMWLFTPQPGVEPSENEAEWRAWVSKFGARTMDLEPARHDELVAWVSHLPQMLSTALAGLLEETFAGDHAQIAAIGGRALRETTRLGASPYSMWRDIALTNSEPIAEALHALEQKLAHIRENLRTPELKEEFRLANEFRERKQ